MQQPNFLILDEPTNDLDIVTLGILEEFLTEFKGCLIVISHDRFFIDNTVDHIFVMQGNGVIKDFPGTYSEYRQWADRQASEAAKVTVSDAPKAERRHAERPERMSYKERVEFEKLEKEIEALSAEKKELEAYFNAGGGDDIAEKSQRYSAVGGLLDEKELRWLELSEKS